MGARRGRVVFSRARRTRPVAVALALLALVGSGASTAGAAPSQLATELASLQAEIGRQGARWVAGETPLSNLTPEQMHGYLGLLETPPEIRAAMPRFSPQAVPLALPSAFDWSDRNGASYVTAVRDQAGCGSCWAFATTAALESRSLITFVRRDEPFDLSEQTLVSCSGAGSCGGGYLGKSAAFLASTGLPAEQCYPYQAANGSCAAACAGWRQASYRIESSLAVAKSVADLKAALVAHGPIPVGMGVYSDFQSYRGGVYSHVSGGYLGGHAVALVGFDDAASCFIVKNSWGGDWGESGFFRISYAEVTGATAFGRDALAYGPAISPFDPADLGKRWTTSPSTVDRARRELVPAGCHCAPRRRRGPERERRQGRGLLDPGGGRRPRDGRVRRARLAGRLRRPLP